MRTKKEQERPDGAAPTLLRDPDILSDDAWAPVGGWDEERPAFRYNWWLATAIAGLSVVGGILAAWWMLG